MSVVPDVRLDCRFPDPDDGPKDELGPKHLFYSGVPIRTARGYNIGVYCVFDDKPRADLDSDSIQFLRDISRTVMGYLESMQSTESYRRGERMVRGLGSFVEGQQGLVVSSRHSEDGEIIQDHRQGCSVSQEEQRSRDEINGSPKVEPPHRPLFSPLQNPEGPPAVAYPTLSPLTSQAAVVTPDARQSETKSIFSRAANIIRDSVEVDGALSSTLVWVPSAVSSREPIPTLLRGVRYHEPRAVKTTIRISQMKRLFCAATFLEPPPLAWPGSTRATFPSL